MPLTVTVTRATTSADGTSVANVPTVPLALVDNTPRLCWHTSTMNLGVATDVHEGTETAAATARAATTSGTDGSTSSTDGADVVAKGTPLKDAFPSQLSVMSYNLLAPIYVRPIDQRTGLVQEFAKFGWAEPAAEVLDWSVRQPRLRKELQASQADVICLQEVQFEANPDGDFVLPQWLQLDGYLPKIPPQGELQKMADRNERVLQAPFPVGNALLCNRARLELVDAAAHTDVDAGLSKSKAKSLTDSTTRVAAVVRGRAGTALANLSPTLVVSVHLDATDEHKRCKQIQRCLEIAAIVKAKDLVVAGDMNTEFLPGSCVAAFVDGFDAPTPAQLREECRKAHRIPKEDKIQDGTHDTDTTAAGPAGRDTEDRIPVPTHHHNQQSAIPVPKHYHKDCTGGESMGPTIKQLASWQTMFDGVVADVRAHRINLARVDSGPTRAGYDHGKDCGPCVSWHLDHILYTCRTLRLHSRWQTLEQDPTSLKAGLPNITCPSDHLPVAACFDVSAPPALTPVAAVDFLARVASVEQAHAARLKQVTDDQERLQKEIEAADALRADGLAAQPAGGADTNPQVDAASDGTGKKKKAKKGKGKRAKPSPEFIAFKRARRETERQVKGELRTEREEFISKCTSLELDYLLGTARPQDWVEKGPSR